MPLTARLAGLIGHPVGYSLSAVMQQAAFDVLGIGARYELWDTLPELLGQRVASLRDPDMLGANVTIPYKRVVMAYLDDCVPEALTGVGAVNTIVREESASDVRLIGHNTDVIGLSRALQEHAAWSTGRHALILGAGGAALAAVGVARREGANVHVAARRIEAAQAVLGTGWTGRAHALDDYDALANILAHVDLLINATPVGTRDPDASPIPLELLRHLPAGSFVFDMVYNPPETALVRAARAAGLRAAGGLEMLLYQGAAAFTLWTGQAAPLGAMRAALGLSDDD